MVHVDRTRFFFTKIIKFPTSSADMERIRIFFPSNLVIENFIKGTQYFRNSFTF